MHNFNILFICLSRGIHYCELHCLLLYAHTIFRWYLLTLVLVQWLWNGAGGGGGMLDLCVRGARVSGVGRRECLSKYARIQPRPTLYRIDSIVMGRGINWRIKCTQLCNSRQVLKTGSSLSQQFLLLGHTLRSIYYNSFHWLLLLAQTHSKNYKNENPWF